MTAEKVGARAIVLGNGQIGWKLGQWCFVHGRRVKQTLEFCRSAGAGSSEIPEVAVRLFSGVAARRLTEMAQPYFDTKILGAC
jgi:hypothetical protein